MFLLTIFLNFIILFLMVFMSVTFFTLLERKVLGYIQLRKEPNKILLKGFFQPVGDFSWFKLFFKEVNYPNNMIFFVFMISPMLSMVVSIIFWFIYPFIGLSFIVHFGLIYVFCYFSFMVYFYVFVMISLSSNSNYSVLGMIRFVSQMISYEVKMMIIIMNLMFLIISFNLNDFFYIKKMWSFFYLFYW